MESKIRYAQEVRFVLDQRDIEILKEMMEATVKETVEASVKETVEATVKETVEASVKETVETTVQEAIKPLQQDICDLKERMSGLENEMKEVKLHLENVTDRNISIIAENHSYLVKKFNESVEAAHNNHMNTVQTSYLIEHVANLENRMLVVEEHLAL